MARVDTLAVGGDAERAAERYLHERGLVTLARNFRCRLGEIDLIGRDGNQLVFVEVRLRGAGSLSRAGTTVDLMKQRKLVRTAALFAARRPEYAMCVMRFDVVAIDVAADGRRSIEWIRDAFRPADSSL